MADEFRLIGRFKVYEHPPQAIELKASDFYFVYPIPSAYLPKKCTDKVGMVCPICENTVMELPNHGDTYQCDKCFHKVQLFGNTLFVWL